MNKTTKLFNIGIVIVCALAILIDIFYGVLCFTVGDYQFDNYFKSDGDIAVIKDTESGETIKRESYFEVNVSSNENNNGIGIAELKICSYVDPNKSDIEVFGYQQIFNNGFTNVTSTNYNFYNTVAFGIEQVNMSSILKVYNLWEQTDRFYYGFMDSELNFKGSTDEQHLIDDNERGFIIEINDTIYKLSMKRNLLTKNNTFAGFGTMQYVSYHIDNIWALLVNMVISNSTGEIDEFRFVDLGEYFIFNEWIPASFGVPAHYEEVKVNNDQRFYIPFYFNYTKNGAASSKDSLFNIIAGASDYYAQGTEPADFWSVNAVYTLTNGDFDTRYSPQLNGYVLNLKSSILENIKSAKRITLILNINVGMVDGKNIVGFDYSAFINIKARELILHGIGNFNLLDNCFKNSDLQVIKRQATVNLTINSNAINNEYTEVIL